MGLDASCAPSNPLNPDIYCSRNLPSGPVQEVIGWAFGHIVTATLCIPLMVNTQYIYVCVCVCVCVCVWHVLIILCRYDIGLGCV